MTAFMFKIFSAVRWQLHPIVRSADNHWNRLRRPFLILSALS